MDDNHWCENNEDNWETHASELVAFADNSSDLFFALNEYGEIITANSGICMRLEYCIEELKGRSALLLNPPEYRDEAREVLGAMLRGECAVAKMPLMTKFKESVAVDTRALLITWRGRKVLICTSRELKSMQGTGGTDIAVDAVYLAMINHAPYGISIFSRSGECVLINQSFAGLCNEPYEQLKDRNLKEYAMLRGTGVFELVDECMNSNEQQDQVLEIPTGDSKRMLHCIAAPCSLGSQSNIILMIIDGDEGETTGDVLGDIEQGYLTQMESSREPILIFGEGMFLECNEAAVQLLGAANRESVLELNLSDISPRNQPDGDGSDAMAARIAEMVDQEGFHCFEWTCKRLDGSEFPADITLSPVIYRGNRVLHVHVKDITERKRTELELVRIKQAIDSASNAIGMATSDGEHFYHNDAFAELFGARMPADLIAAGGAPALYETPETGCEVFKAIMSGKPWAGELKMRNLATDKVMDINLRADAVIDEGGEVIALIGIHTDVTESKRILMELERARDEANAANKAKGQFLANMSHEIRTPLNAILGFADLLEEGAASEAEQRKYFQIIHQNGDHLLALIKDILDLSSIESNRLSIRIGAVSIFSAIENTTGVMKARAEEEGVNLGIEYEYPLPETIITDNDRLSQILMNLISNGVKFTPNGTVRIKVSYESDGLGCGRIHYEVEDTGVGLDPEEFEMIFSAFAQSDASLTRTVGGTGLGLMISRRLAKLLGGDITVQSAKGVGSTFSLSIAVEVPPDVKMIDDEEHGRRIREINAVKSTQSIALQGHILLVEDVPTNRKLASHILRRVGLTVDVAENGAVACEMVETAAAGGKPYDLVLMDIMMPVMDGFEATRKLCASGFRQPIIALTASALKEDRDRCLAAGCRDYSTKPYRRDKLIALVAKYLKTAPEPISA
ncbi:MAG: PAS domain S-box protein [bacterium]|nr:PAS domain S-box protein [bacterium]